MKIDELVIFNNLKNARGYQLTGTTISNPYWNDGDEEVIDVLAYGLYGPGSDTTIYGVLITDLRVN
jgi:hypothetical protein